MTKKDAIWRALDELWPDLDNKKVLDRAQAIFKDTIDIHYVYNKKGEWLAHREEQKAFEPSTGARSLNGFTSPHHTTTNGVATPPAPSQKLTALKGFLGHFKTLDEVHAAIDRYQEVAALVDHW